MWMLTRNLLAITFSIGSILLCVCLFTDFPFISVEVESLRTGKKNIDQRKISELWEQRCHCFNSLTRRRTKRATIYHTWSRQPHAFQLLSNVLLTTWPAFNTFFSAAQFWSFYLHLPCCFRKITSSLRKHLTAVLKDIQFRIWFLKIPKISSLRKKYINRWVLMM